MLQSSSLRKATEYGRSAGHRPGSSPSSARTFRLGLAATASFKLFSTATPQDISDCANEFKGRHLDTLNHRGLDSPEYELELGFMLSELYQLVGKPAIQRLRELGLPEQPCVWWCTASTYCSLPLHAVGPIPQTTEVKIKPQHSSDLYIRSYTPTLSALIEFRHHYSPTHRESLTAPRSVAKHIPSRCANGDESHIGPVIGASDEPCLGRRDEFCGGRWNQRIKGQQLDHLACHGTLVGAKPFDASFELYGGERLTLLEIVRSPTFLR